MTSAKLPITFRGNGKPLVLLHAYPLSQDFWNFYEPPAGWQLIVTNFPGFGSSPLPTSDITLDELAKLLFSELKKAGIAQPIVLGGISMGGYWALEFLRQFEDFVQGAILISTRAGLDKPEARQKRLETAERVLAEGVAWIPDAMIPGLLGSSTRSNRPDLVQGVTLSILAALPAAVAMAQRAMANRRDQTDLLQQLTLPTLILAGREDTLIPCSESELMAKSISQARLKLFEKAGHLLPLEAAEEFKKCVGVFLQDLSSTVKILPSTLC